jgi:mannobiose 2-epimerase
MKRVRRMAKVFEERIYERAFVNSSILNECENGVDNTTRVWWMQAEAIVGFANAYRYTKDEKYKAACYTIWGYVKEYFIDKREGSEWFWSVSADGIPDKKPIVEPWKCPYHNGRMCIEIINAEKDAE